MVCRYQNRLPDFDGTDADNGIPVQFRHYYDSDDFRNRSAFYLVHHAAFANCSAGFAG